MLALVDPDNRRPVDWAWHQAMLRRLMGDSPPDAATLKLFVTMRLLGLRARRPDVLVGGSYEPLEAGPDVCGFLRGDAVLVVVPVREARPGGTLRGAAGQWRDVLSGEERALDDSAPLAALVEPHGFAVLEREQAD
jgi:(1->4)-alpha-D-glucan 1-alpha-D-glucosylmutase